MTKLKHADFSSFLVFKLLPRSINQYHQVNAGMASLAAHAAHKEQHGAKHDRFHAPLQHSEEMPAPLPRAT
jgi:hypothetical protein